MWKLYLRTWTRVHPQKEHWTRDLQRQHLSTDLLLTHSTHPVRYRQTHNWYHRAPGHNPPPAGPKFGTSTRWGRERQKERDTLSGVPSAPRLHASIDLLLDPFRSSGQLGWIRINFSHTPFLHWFLLFFPFHCISLLYVSFSYPSNITTLVHWSSLRRNSLQVAG